MIDYHMRGPSDTDQNSGFVSMLDDCRPGMLAVEIGSYAGQTLQLIHDSGLFNRIISIDPFIDNYDPDDHVANTFPMHEVRKRFYNRIIKLPNILHLNLSSIEASELFEDGSIDFLYIDGDHRYETVKADIRHFLPKMRNVSILAGHDYIHESIKGIRPELEGVRLAVDELLCGPDLIYNDYSWLKYLGFRPKKF